uniref:Uncharacterized protein n=1 Tax=Meloidogyne javanica TaxID=6303 RepID=A0A915LRJ9_MELJA
MATINVAKNMLEPVKSLPKYFDKFKKNVFYYISDKHGDRWANRNMAWFIIATWTTEEKKRMKPDLVRDALARAGISTN